ncbi:AtpZ/AtpI family protein [Thermosipho atlanticus]|uniref:Putative F0F1-ATPase subunit Ca2+/Mg2+ transporter n=1 Tax=Thermosipho atlanticus DSM 15807 TaxID=1123380 RepID=A0A1M5RSI3_9BACT|nr:AtpZ/AtpI family protein [Thermosipho atlanticus]SHH29244.1 Putative F0F1-ATPase subunit Ca2+/Mg2+ transporter [Thermosipho atlanticus DSM 15807]
MKKNNKDNIGKEIVKLNLVLVFGTTVLGNIIVGYFLGRIFDWLFKTEKLFVIIFLFFGAISGIYNGVKQLLKEVERIEKRRK